MIPRWFLRLAVLTLTSSLWGLPSPQERVSQAVFYSADRQVQLSCRLLVDDGTGDQKIRELRVSVRTEGGEERFLAQVTAPPSLRNLKFLRIRTKEGTGVWLKTSRGIQRLAPEGDPQPLFGSDFTTADFQPGSKDWTEVSRESQETVVLERAADPHLGWSKQVLVLRASDSLILRSDFLDAAGQLVRRYSVTAFTTENRPRRVLLEDLKNKRHSELEMTQAASEKDMPLALFAPGNL